MRKKIQYLMGYLAGTWEYRLRPRMSWDYVRGYCAGLFGR